MVRGRVWLVSKAVAKPSVDIQVSTLERIERILQEAEEPVSKTYIHARLKELNAGTTPARLNRALQYLYDHRMIVSGSKGIQWTFSGNERLRRAAALGRRI
jgi:hypothetical protein